MGDKICSNNISLRNLLDQNKKNKIKSKNNRSEVYLPMSDEREYNILHADARARAGH